MKTFLTAYRDGGPATVHQYGFKADLAGPHLGQHIQNVVNLGFAIRVGAEYAVVNEPKLIGFGIEINAVDNADAFDKSMRVATVLSSDHRAAGAVRSCGCVLY